MVHTQGDNIISAEDLGNACSGLGDDVIAELREIAKIYSEASGFVIKLSSWVGGQAENIVNKMPADWHDNINDVADTLLRASYNAAAITQADESDESFVNRWLGKTQGELWHKIASSVSGALGGAGGLTTTAVDLAATTTLALRSIQQIAASYGEDISDEQVRLACLSVFGFGGPLSDDDEVETGLYAVRMTLSGHTISEMIKKILPRFGVVIGEKTLAQATPLLGAAVGATINPVFVGYYQQMAHVHFRLRRLENKNDPEQLHACFERVMRQHKIKAKAKPSRSKMVRPFLQAG